MHETEPVPDGNGDDHRAAVDFLRAHHVLTLAVTDAEGPWAAALFYVSDGVRCYILSDPKTRHARAIAADPRVAATIQNQPEDWTSIRGIQLEGRARRLTGTARARALARYLARFSTAVADPRLVGAFKSAAAYEVVPSRLFLIDNRRFGQRVDVPLVGQP